MDYSGESLVRGARDMCASSISLSLRRTEGATDPLCGQHDSEGTPRDALLELDWN